MSGDIHLSRPVGEQGRNTQRPSLSRDENNRRQENTSWDIVSSRKAVLPINLEINRDKKGTRDKKISKNLLDEGTEMIPPRNLDGET